MIRIDLGSDEFKKGGGGSPLSGILSKLRLGRKSSGGDGEGTRIAAGGFDMPRRGLGTLMGSLGGTVFLILAVAGACVPHLVVTRYKEFIIEDHEDKKKALELQVSQIEKEISKLKPFQKELESYEQQKRLVKERLETIRSLLAARGTPVNVLDAIGQSLPQRAWINGLDFDIKNVRPVVKLTGQSFANEDISDYVDKLSESVYLQDVVLDNVSTTKGFGTNADVKGFQLEVVPKGMKGLGPARATAAAPPKPTAPAANQKTDAGKKGPKVPVVPE